jgi:hypothetical protein
MLLVSDTIYSDVLRFFADLDDVSLAVADFEELSIATVLNRSRENATICEVLVAFL